MRGLVIGGSGFIGSHLVDRLLKQGIAVRVYDRTPERFRPSPAAVDFRRGDFADTATLAEALVDVDVVYHFLSTSVPSTSNLDPVADIQGNLIGTVRLLELMRNAEVRRLVYLSSGGTIYGPPETNPVSESHPERPISSYGVVKSAIEKYILMESHLHGLSPMILRPSNPYGSRQGHGGVQGVIGTFLSRIAHDEPIQIWGDGSVVRDFIHVSDLAELCAQCGKSNLTGIFNAGSGEGESIRRVLEIIAEVTGRQVIPTFRPGRGFDVPRVVLDISAIRSRLDWQPKISLERGIEDTWHWIREQAK
ncbi:MAG: NAD-dependent epimerase/dehydratase family protein [Halieaceae bacterium]|uniref:NAD-dependent epimerase/dehydratase family protein n=1 Tax=Haliea alexandrii TaxID=2448162 RepID=UPI000F0B193E|nr:NAD-dependent epimerase/dehydratase family protein [Haliea alexandrii]MCR9185097.1 NAD-dependent epimerase/dehydratase family protein [Halieaceae bacterium]